MLPARGYLLVVSFDPQADQGSLAEFRAQYGLSETVPVLGPYDGKLSDLGEGLRLFWPDKPEPWDAPNPGFVPYELVERVKYSNSVPMAFRAGGTGQSLQRRDALAYGNEPLNWFVAPPSPGRGTVVDRDKDAMPDDWETANGLNPQDPGDAGQDPDGDQANNLQEFLAGTEPDDAISVFRILKVQPEQDRGVRLSFFAVPGRTYTIQARDRLATDAWVDADQRRPRRQRGIGRRCHPARPRHGWIFPGYHPGTAVERSKPCSGKSTFFNAIVH